jgi:hypothetical protein
MMADAYLLSQLSQAIGVLTQPCPEPQALATANAVCSQALLRPDALIVGLHVLQFPQHADVSTDAQCQRAKEELISVVGLQLVLKGIASATQDRRTQDSFDLKAVLAQILNLLSARADDLPPTYAVRTKVALVVSDVILREFPQRWTSMVSDLRSVSNSSMWLPATMLEAISLAIVECMR